MPQFVPIIAVRGRVYHINLDSVVSWYLSEQDGERWIVLDTREGRTSGLMSDNARLLDFLEGRHNIPDSAADMAIANMQLEAQKKSLQLELHSERAKAESLASENTALRGQVHILTERSHWLRDELALARAELAAHRPEPAVSHEYDRDDTPPAPPARSAFQKAMDVLRRK